PGPAGPAPAGSGGEGSGGTHRSWASGFVRQWVRGWAPGVRWLTREWAGPQFTAAMAPGGPVRAVAGAVRSPTAGTPWLSAGRGGRGEVDCREELDRRKAEGRIGVPDGIRKS